MRALLRYASTTAVTTGALPAIPYPAASSGTPLQINNLILLTVYNTNGSGSSITTPSGYTAVNTTYPANGGSGTIYQFYKLVTASDIIAGSVTVAASYSNAPIIAYLHVLSNVNTTTPIAGFAIAAGANTSGKYVLAGSVTPTGPGCTPIFVSTNSNSAYTSGQDLPSGWSLTGYFYAGIQPGNGFNDSFAAIGPSSVDAVTAMNPQITWEGQYSNFQICSMLTLINPAPSVPTTLQPTEYPNIASALSGATIEPAVTTSTPTTPALSVRNIQQLVGAMAFGQSSGSATSNPIYYDPSGSRQRLSMTLDGSNNRTAVSISLS